MLKHILKNTAIISLCLLGFATADIERGLSHDFKNWLDKNGYGDWGFDRADL